jgi:cytochrome c oxidase subunit 4
MSDVTMNDRRPGQAQSAAGGPVSGGHALGHILPPRILLVVWAGLVVLTGLTLAAARVNLGGLNLWLAMVIATAKACLVALYFMHLRYDRPIYAIIFLGALLFVTLFVGLVLLDTQSYQPQMIPGYAPAIHQ